MRSILLALFAFWCGVQLFGECRWSSEPTIISDPRSPSTRYLIFDEPNYQEFWQGSVPDQPILAQYWHWVTGRVSNTDPYALLERQREIFAKSGFPELQNQVKEFDEIIHKEVGTVRSANCLELLLFAEHAKHFEGGQVTQEFDAHILVNERSKRIRVYFASGKQESGGAPSLSLFDDQVKKDRAQGFRMAYALHNHPFAFDNAYGDIAGTTIPSEADVASYIKMKKESNLERAVITNGMSTLELNNADFEILKKTLLPSYFQTYMKSWSLFNLLAPLTSWCSCQ